MKAELMHFNTKHIFRTTILGLLTALVCDISHGSFRCHHLHPPLSMPVTAAGSSTRFDFYGNINFIPSTNIVFSENPDHAHEGTGIASIRQCSKFVNNDTNGFYNSFKSETAISKHFPGTHERCGFIQKSCDLAIARKEAKEVLDELEDA
jgi:hypothetical protein